MTEAGEIDWALGYPFALGVMLASAAIAGLPFWRAAGSERGRARWLHLCGP